MSRRPVLPRPPFEDVYMERLTAELTRILGRMELRLRRLEEDSQISTDITIPPPRIGAIAVVPPNVYIATGMTPSDWTIVS